MNELELKYGCNPNQKPARVFMKNGVALPFTVLNGKPGYINLLDAFNSWQLVRELKEATGLPAAASFKHVSPAGAALGLPLDEVDKRVYFVAPGAALSPIACAYIRARGADRLCSYGDWAALSDECDAATAAYLKNEVSDGIIAPAYSDEALAILKTKRAAGTMSCRSTLPMFPRRWSRRMFSASPSSRGTTTAKSMKACSKTSSPKIKACPRVQSAICSLPSSRSNTPSPTPSAM